MYTLICFFTLFLRLNVFSSTTYNFCILHHVIAITEFLYEYFDRDLHSIATYVIRIESW